MNPLLFIASITNSWKIKKWCAIKRYRQHEAKWAKEKTLASTRASKIPLEKVYRNYTTHSGE